MTSVLNRLFARDETSRRADRRRNKIQPVLDGLEKREVLSVTIQQQGAYLMLNATAAPENNTVAISQVGNQYDVAINGVDHFYALQNLGAIQFNAGATPAGTIQTFVNDTSLTTTAYGGAGTNHFVAGHRWDFFHGGTGANTFDAKDGYVIFMGSGKSNDFNLGTGSGFILADSHTSKVHSDTLTVNTSSYVVAMW